MTVTRRTFTNLINFFTFLFGVFIIYVTTLLIGLIIRCRMIEKLLDKKLKEIQKETVVSQF
jgi:hypothetical protein